MKYINLKFLKDQYKVFLLLAVLSVLGSYYLISELFGQALIYRYQLSFVDLLMPAYQLKLPYYYMLILPVSMYLIYQINQYDFTINVLIRHEKKGELFLIQILRILICSILFTVIYFGSVYIMASLLGGRLSECNWDIKDSFFCDSTGMTTRNKPSKAKMAAYYCCYTWLTFMISNVILSVLKWATGNYLCGFIVMLICPILLGDLYTYFVPFPDQCMDFKKLAIHMLIVFLGIVAVIAIGYKRTERKEFLNAEKKEERL